MDTNPDAPTAPTRLDHPVVRLLPVIALLLVAVTQIYLATVPKIIVGDKGGGFGMFSQVDQWANRVVFIYLINGDAEQKLAPAFSQIDFPQIKQLVANPTDRRFEAFARHFAQQAAARNYRFNGVRLELWTTGLTYDAGTETYTISRSLRKEKTFDHFSRGSR